MALQQVIAGVSVFVNGIDFIGQARSFMPPMAEAETLEVDQPGHAGPMRIPSGRLAGDLEARCTFGVVDPRIEHLVADPGSINTPIVFVYALTDGQQHRQVRHSISGLWTVTDNRDDIGGRRGGGRDANQVTPTYRVSIRKWEHTIDGFEVRFVDIEQGIHRIQGVDVLADIRALLR